MGHTCGEPNEIELTAAHRLFHRSFSDPKQRPAFDEMRTFFKDMVVATPNAGPAATGLPASELQNYLKNSACGGAILDELNRTAALTLPDIYSTSEYERLGIERKSSILREESIVRGLDGVQITAKLAEATKELHVHSTKYTKLFDGWRKEESLLKLRPVFVDVAARISTGPYANVALVQPNPWEADDIKVDSKRYLSRVIAVFGGGGAKYGVDIDPAADVVAACAGVVDEFGADIELIKGPPKKEQRIMEKARSAASDGQGCTCREPFNSTPMAGQFDFVWLSARTPHGAYVW